MSSLTPLHFRRYISGELIRGFRNYYTDCRRFMIINNAFELERQWQIIPAHNEHYSAQWLVWLHSLGLDDEDFVTRKAAVITLEAALVMDCLMDVDDPTTTLSL